MKTNFFYIVPDSFKQRLDNIFCILDTKNKTYSLNGKQKRKGFIIKSKVKAGQSTPMRDIKNSIENIFSDLS